MALRSVALALALAAPLHAGESRLGTLLRWYLAEPSASKREDLLESIREVSGNDPAVVAKAIREGRHFAWPASPAFRKGGKPPDYSRYRPRIQPVGDCAGDYAELLLPPGYDRARAWPLHIDLLPFDLAPSADAVTVRIDLRRHPEAAAEAQAAEMLVLSLLAESMDQVHVDPARLFLRAQDARAELAWYIALQNPDRFAGLLAGGGWWGDGGEVVGHGRYFSALAVVRRQQDLRQRTFLDGLVRLHPGHVVLAASAGTDRITAWLGKTARLAPPARVELVCNRPSVMRAHWLRAAPRERSLKEEVLGGQWKATGLRIPASITATIDTNEKNLVTVTTDRINAFWICVDPAMFDADEPLRVRVDGAIAVAKYIDHNIAYLLEDYLERRDPLLLYSCRLAFTARGP